MNLPGEEVLRLLKAFENNNVDYLIVGGFAANYHGYNRATSDIDLWLKDTAENRINLINSLDELGYGRFNELMTVPFIAGYCEILLDNGIYVDFMNSILGFKEIDFDNCFRRANVSMINSIQVRFIHFNDLLHSKLSSDKPKDIQDAIELKRIKDESDPPLNLNPQP
jgi:Nucleotidyl transferase of unknown function (DUF2204)